MTDGDSPHRFTPLIALAEAERMNLSLPGLGLAKQLYESVRAQGYGRKGTQALMLALEAMSGVKR